MTAFLNAIGTATPIYGVHAAYLDWARGRVTPRRRGVFDRMAERAGIGERWSVLAPGRASGRTMSAMAFYSGATPGTGDRMVAYADHAPDLALDAVDALRDTADLGAVTHLVVASCTGFVAPGIDQIIATRLGLPSEVERLLIGFMGCYGAAVALRSARHIVRSEPTARVLVICIELCTLHLQDTDEVDRLLAQLQFGDGAAAALVTGDAVGFRLDRPFSIAVPTSAQLITWNIGDQGFAMHLSGEVPRQIGRALADPSTALKVTGGLETAEVDGWAVHAGGRTILDAVGGALDLPASALDHSRAVLRENGNVSSATLLFVLARILEGPPIRHGVALAFGPGLAAEGLGFASVA
jgi:predicted naringenin-chalcone synthase